VDQDTPVSFARAFCSGRLCGREHARIRVPRAKRGAKLVMRAFARDVGQVSRSTLIY